MLQENNPDATCMSLRLCTWYVVVLAIYMSVSKLATTKLVSRMTNRHGHWVLDVGVWEK